jgi:hypothetical protein
LLAQTYRSSSSVMKFPIPPIPPVPPAREIP